MTRVEPNIGSTLVLLFFLIYINKIKTCIRNS
nr:MAG TPA: hypothetical protein [Caudoviricetes sp.]